jgi:hypothetical protein
LFSKGWILTGLRVRRGEVVYRLLSVYNLPSSDRSPETYENVRIGSLAMVPVTFYS